MSPQRCVDQLSQSLCHTPTDIPIVANIYELAVDHIQPSNLSALRDRFVNKRCSFGPNH